MTSEVIHSDTDTEERVAMLGRFQDGLTKLLVNCQILTEGVNYPAASVVLLARGVGHASSYLQMTGRALRPHPGKTHATLIDLPGVSHIHGLPLDRREYSLDHGIQQATGKNVGVKDCPVCGNAMHPAIMECDNCGHAFEVSERYRPKIHSLALESVWAGDQTPHSDMVVEYKRLRNLASRNGWSIAWAVKEYTKLFGQAPDLRDVSPEERRREHERLLTMAHEKGYKAGWAGWLYKQTFGVWPPRVTTNSSRIKSA